MSDRILTLNAGSSSLKFALFEVAEPGNLALVSKGKIEGTDAEPLLVAVDPGGAELADHRWPGDAKIGHEEIFAELINWAETHGEEARSLPSGTGLCMAALNSLLRWRSLTTSLYGSIASLRWRHSTSRTISPQSGPS